MKKKIKIKETDLFYPLNRYFSALGYTVNTEVENKRGYKRADILLTKDSEGEKNKEIIGIETKTNLSFELLDQADYWTKYTDFNYVCVPVIKGNRPKIVNKIIKSLGFGLIEIDLERYYTYYSDLDDNVVLLDDDGHPDIWRLGIELTVAPQLNNPTVRNKNDLRSVIYDEHQHWSIGGQRGNKTYVSGYKLLMADVYGYLRKLRKENPETDGWATIPDIVDYLSAHSNNVVRNHYKNMKAGIRQALREFEAGDIQSVNTGKVVMYRVMDGSTKYEDLNKR